jgi:hypothetical protein
VKALAAINPTNPTYAEASSRRHLPKADFPSGENPKAGLKRNSRLSQKEGLSQVLASGVNFFFLRAEESHQTLE